MQKFAPLSLRRMLTLALALVILASHAGMASANNGAYTWRNETISFEVYGSCSDPDGLYQVTLVSSGASHFVENANGYKFNHEEHGTYFIEPIDASSPVTYSGRYSDHFVDTGYLTGDHWSFNRTFINVGQGSDGTHEIFRFTNIWTVTPNGKANERESGMQWICN